MKIKVALLAILLAATAPSAQILKPPPLPHDNSLRALPDLVAKEARRQKPGTEAIVITVANTGKGDAKATQWVFGCGWYPNDKGEKNAIFPSSPIDLPAMKSGEVRKLIQQCSAPAGKKIRVQVKLDVGDKVTEANESNNGYYNDDVQ